MYYRYIYYFIQYSILSGGTNEKMQTLQYLQQAEIYFQKILPISSTPKNSPLSPSNNNQTSPHTPTPPIPLPPKIPGEKKVKAEVKIETNPVKPAIIKSKNAEPTIFDLAEKFCVSATHSMLNINYK